MMLKGNMDVRRMHIISGNDGGEKRLKVVVGVKYLGVKRGRGMIIAVHIEECMYRALRKMLSVLNMKHIEYERVKRIYMRVYISYGGGHMPMVMYAFGAWEDRMNARDRRKLLMDREDVCYK